MAQVLKPDVRDRIMTSALQVIAERGYTGASMAAIASQAGTAPANVYRYFHDKASLFDAIVPTALVDRHDVLLETRIGALNEAPPASFASAEALLEFWIAHRLEVTILLDRAAGTPYAGYPGRFVTLLTQSAERHIGVPLQDHHQQVLRLVFDNTRRSIAHILHTNPNPQVIRTLIEGLWSYQLPGLAGLSVWISATPAPRTVNDSQHEPSMPSPAGVPPLTGSSTKTGSVLRW